MERAFASIHQANHHGHSIKLIYASCEGRVGQYLEFPDTQEEMIVGPIAANYPHCSMTTVEGFDNAPSSWNTWSASLELSPELFPILRHAQFEDSLNHNFADPITGILRAIKPEAELFCRVEIHFRPATTKRRKNADRAVRLLDREFFRIHHRLAHYYATHITRRRWLLAWMLGIIARRTPHPVRTSLDTSASRQHDREEHLQAASNKIGGHLFETSIRIIAQAPPAGKPLAVSRIHQIAGAFGAFTKAHLATFHLKRLRKGFQHGFRGRGDILSEDELGTLFHPPTATTAAESMTMSEFRELEPPSRFFAGENDSGVALGRVRFREDRRLIGIDQEARRRHTYIVGATGTGKSTLLLNMIHQDMEAGRGVTVFDNHGDLGTTALSLVPKRRTNEVIVFDATSDSIVPFNPLACADPKRIDQVTSGVVSAFKKLYDSWGPRLENLLRYAVFVTVEQQGTLLDMLRLLTDISYRDQVVHHVSDEVVRSFWQNEFASWTGQYRTEAVSSVTNKIMPFLTNRQLRAITTEQGKRGLDLRQVMDEGKILVVNLSRGKLGQDNATILGSLLLTSIEQAAMTRADLAEEARRDHFLYLDEFQSLVTPSTSIMLSESRKYRLSLILSHQLTRQLDPATYHSVIGNCGSMVAFRVGLEDAELLAPAMSKYPGQLLPADLGNLPNYTAYAKLLDGRGVPSAPCSISTLAPPHGSDERAMIVNQMAQRRGLQPHQKLMPSKR